MLHLKVSLVPPYQHESFSSSSKSSQSTFPELNLIVVTVLAAKLNEALYCVRCQRISIDSSGQHSDIKDGIYIHCC